MTQTTTTTGAPATPGIVTMGRKQFHGFLYDLYRCRERGVNNDVEADMTIGDISHVEILLSPDGPLVAVHRDDNTVTVIRADLSNVGKAA